MKRIFLLLLACSLIMLTSCQNVIVNQQGSGTSTLNSAAAFLEQTSDKDLCELFLYAHAMGFSIPFNKYTGFNSPTELNSNGLFNFFLFAANSDDYYDNNTKTYIIPVNSANEFFSRYFESYCFKPEEATHFIDWYNGSKQQYESNVFLALLGPLEIEITDKISNGDGTITLKGNYLFENEVRAHEELTLKIVNGNTMFQKYKIISI